MKVRKRFGRYSDASEDINPADGLTNLTDVMLVLICGLLLALITNWNLDIEPETGELTNVTQGQEVTEEMPGLQGNPDDTSADIDEYEKMGTVYRDPSTGKLYMVTSDD